MDGPGSDYVAKPAVCPACKEESLVKIVVDFGDDHNTEMWERSHCTSCLASSDWVEVKDE